MKKFEYNKLVRNKIINKMLKAGVKISHSNLSEIEYTNALNKKLLEEANEVIEKIVENNSEALKTEIGDLLEVIYEIIKNNNFNIDEIEQERLNKKDINGYFDKDNYVKYIEVDSNNKELINYLNDKNRKY